MSINDSQQSVSKPKDIPRVGFTCGSYLAVHNVHYFPVLKRAPLLTPIEASLTSSLDATFRILRFGFYIPLLQREKLPNAKP